MCAGIATARGLARAHRTPHPRDRRARDAGVGVGVGALQ